MTWALDNPAVFRDRARCQNCLFYEPVERHNGKGDCRRAPPVTFVGDQAPRTTGRP